MSESFIVDRGPITEKDMVPPPRQYMIEYKGRLILLTVYDSKGDVSNTYIIDNDNDQFCYWCVENGHAKRNLDQEFDPDEEDSFGFFESYDTDSCKKNADLILAYFLEQIKTDFP